MQQYQAAALGSCRRNSRLGNHRDRAVNRPLYRTSPIGRLPSFASCNATAQNHDPLSFNTVWNRDSDKEYSAVVDTASKTFASQLNLDKEVFGLTQFQAAQNSIFDYNYNTLDCSFLDSNQILLEQTSSYFQDPVLGSSDYTNLTNGFNSPVQLEPASVGQPSSCAQGYGFGGNNHVEVDEFEVLGDAESTLLEETSFLPPNAGSKSDNPIHYNGFQPFDNSISTLPSRSVFLPRNIGIDSINQVEFDEFISHGYLESASHEQPNLYSQHSSSGSNGFVDYNDCLEIETGFIDQPAFANAIQNLVQFGSPAQGVHCQDSAAHHQQLNLATLNHPPEVSINPAGPIAAAVTSNTNTAALPIAIPRAAIARLPNRNAGSFRCDYPGCNEIIKRFHDLARHKRKHGPPQYRCLVQDCPRGLVGFTRTDKLREHQQKMHVPRTF
ncbi:hypothetical protein GLAREA_06362 [Glarea lozoyensis ATCC 20868]|uniref:C2H2-type domain-containing protein n=1 Tax=Glarea lozoyensis (strain ATCC 20868 / MF5171) TaxID=1116229 RepID=S3D6I5_GLAL2|nr:uncharacterized protein GLAREA_06362 [Glarea lozoyensis ATCC 20868]EPE33350.1 hypothetical protein GLAREA_06362 [Glarea lozoyensis ATCC 20868]